MKMIQDFNFKGKKAIVRVDFNVPLDKKTFTVTDDTRIRGALLTINKILNEGGCLILMSHLGRPEGRMEKYSLKPVIPVLEKLLGKKVLFADDCLGESAVKMSAALKPGEILLLENVRFYPEEEGKPILPETVTDEEKKAAKAEMKIKQKEMAKKLAGYAEIYVNDAFGTAHRAHATTAVMADYFGTDKRMFGFLINSELAAMDKVLKDPQKPFTAIMGGAKVSDKIMLIENLLNRVDNLIIGGGMTYTFIKAMGGKIGKSLCEEDKLDLALKLIEKAKEKKVKLYLPVDSLNADKFENDANTRVTAVDKVEVVPYVVEDIAVQLDPLVPHPNVVFSHVRLANPEVGLKVHDSAGKGLRDHMPSNLTRFKVTGERGKFVVELPFKKLILVSLNLGHLLDRTFQRPEMFGEDNA